MKTHIGLKKTGCQGFCELGPLVRITKNDETVQYVKVQLDDCQELFERAVLGDEVVERLLYRKEKSLPSSERDSVYRKTDQDRSGELRTF